jgi:carboxypeptidase D
MRWYAEQGFTLAANFHGGAVVVNYPYDQIPGVPSGQPAICPDDALFQDISLRYASLNPVMSASTQFANGITNGSEWYILVGGLQDWAYRFLGSLHVTIELSNTKWPAAATLDSYWANNRDAMLAYLESVHMGVRGLVTDRVTGTGVETKVSVENNAQPMFGHAGLGNYHRPLPPGTYNLAWSAPGYITYRKDGVAVADGAETRVNVGISDGDVNGDGQVNSTDLQLVINAVLGRASAVTVDADVDGRGVSATDVQAVVNMALNRG